MGDKVAFIINHYEALSMYCGEVRLSSWAQKLSSEGYQVYVIAASWIHSFNIELIKDDRKYLIKDEGNIHYVYLKTPPYKSNMGIDRVINMIYFYFAAKKVMKRLPKPEFIIAESPNPLACVAAIRFSKKKIPVLSDIVDLWPESIAVYKHISKNNPIMKLLYLGERWIYENSDSLIFSMAGAYDYIVDRGWNKTIPQSKVHYINMGVDLEVNDKNAREYPLNDPVFTDSSIFKVAYTGSVRLVNNLKLLCDAGKIVLNRNIDNIYIMIHGAGDQVDALREYCTKEGISNVHLYGKIDKRNIPYVLSHSDLCILCYQNTPLLRYGGSMNKMFDYFASGKPIIANAKMGYSIIDSYECGVELGTNSPEELADAILNFYYMSSDKRMEYGNASRKAAEDYEKKVLSSKMTIIVEEMLNNFKK